MTRLLLPLLATSSLLTLVGCPDSTPPAPITGQFGAADEVHLVRALMSASGTDAMIPWFIASGYASGEGLPSCPAIVRDGATITVTGGCDTDDGRVEGRLVMQNVPGLLGGGTDHDPDAPQVLTFEDFSVVDADGPLFLDGTTRTDPATRTTTSDLTIDVGGIWSRSKLTLTTGTDGRTTAAAGSLIDVEGLGEASVSGTWSLAKSAPSGQLTLTGEQVLVFEIADAATDTDCIPYTIEGGDAGELCLTDNE